MGKQRVKFSFPEDMVKQPVIYKLGHDYEIVTSIRRADVREDTGWVILELEGEDAEIERGLAWIGTTGVRVDLVSGDIVDG